MYTPAARFRQGSLRLFVCARGGFFKSKILRSGAVRFGAVRFFQKEEISRCGSVRCSDIVNPTVRFDAVT